VIVVVNSEPNGSTIILPPCWAARISCRTLHATPTIACLFLGIRCFAADSFAPRLWAEHHRF
jgi:hypothetical protein